jgi:hypothetical protein
MNEEYLNYEMIDPASGLTQKPNSSNGSDYLDYTLLPGTSVSKHEPVVQVGGIVGKRSRYDENLTLKDLNNLERERALHQPTSHKAFNAIVGGIASGALTALEDVGYLLDFDNNIKRLQGLEEVDTNAFSQVMEDAKKGLEQAMPIHRETDQVFDWSDPGFYFSSLKGILDSAVGFAIPGMAVSKGIGAVQKGIKLGAELTRVNKFVQRSARLDKYLSMIGQNPKIAQAINSGVSGYITNFAEGKMMAIEQFENSMGQMQQGLFEQNYNEQQALNPEMSKEELIQKAEQITNLQLETDKLKEFETIAGEKANQFINRNKVFALTDAIGLHGIFKAKGVTRNLLKEKNLTTWAKRFGTLSTDNLLIQGAKEGAEEIGQNIIQMEGQYQSRKEAGLDVSDIPEDLTQRVIQFATSDQALLEGLMGVFGGGPQRVFTEAVSGNLAPSSKKQYAARYQEQQEQIEANKQFVNQKLSWLAQAEALKAESYATGKDNFAEIVKKSVFRMIAKENFQKGTTEKLERDLQDVANTTPEEAKANGWDNNYKEQAEIQLRELQRMESDYNRYGRYENQADIFFNRENRQSLQQDINEVRRVRDEIEADLEFQENRDPQMEDRLTEYNKTLETLTENLNELDVAYKFMISPETQIKERKKVKDKKEQQEKIIKDLKDKVKRERKEEEVETKRKKAEKKDKVDKERQAEKKDKIEQQAEQQAEEAGIVEDETPDMFDVEAAADAQIPEDKDVTDIPADQIEQEKRKLQLDSEFNDATTNLTLEGSDKVSLTNTLINLTKTAKNSLGVSIEDVVDEMIDRVGVVATENAFPALEEAYKIIYPNYQIIGDFNKFIKPTVDERREIDGQNSHGNVSTKTQYTDNTNEQIKNAQDQIDVVINGKNIDEDPSENNIKTDYLRVRSGATKLAYLARKYINKFKKGLASKEDIEDAINADMLVPELLDQHQFKVGDKVRLEIDDNENNRVYDEDTGEITTWGAKIAKWNADPKLTTEQIKEKILEQTPIAVYSNGKKIGYLHETIWINEKNISGNVAQDKDRNRTIRRYMLKNKTFDTKISKKTTGYLQRSVDGNIKTSQAMPEKSLPIVVGRKGNYVTDRNTDYKGGKLLNKTEPQEGVTYIMIPIGIDQEIAIPLLMDKVSEHEQILEGMMTALEIFYYEKNDEKSNKIVDGILKESNNTINITTPQGITDYLQMFINNYDIGESSDLKIFLAENTGNKQSRTVFTSMKRRENDVNFQISRGQGIGRTFINKDWISKHSPNEQTVRLEKIREKLSNMYLQTNLENTQDKAIYIDTEGNVTSMSYNEHTKNTSKIPFISFNIGTEKNPNYVYTSQPVIEMDFSAIEEETEETEIEKFKRLLKEWNDPNTTPERKDELEPIIAGMYYAEGEMITYEEKKKQTAEKKKAREKPQDIKPENPTGFEDYDEDMNPQDTDFTANIAAPLDKDALARMKKDADVTVEDGELKGVIIADMGAAKQRQVTDYMRAKLVETLYKQKKVQTGKIYGTIKKMFESNRDKAERNLAKAKVIGDEELIARHQTALNEFNLILNNWSKLVALTDDQLTRIDDITIKPGDEEEDKTTEEKEATNENDGWGDVITLNPVRGLASEIKWFMSGIRKFKVDHTGKVVPSKNYLGLSETMTFQELYNIVQRLTANKKPDFDEIMFELRRIANDSETMKTFPFMKEFVSKLEGAPQQIKNQFVVGMTNHDVNMRFVMWGQNYKGEWELVEQQSNASAIADVVLRDWYVNLIVNTAVRNPNDATDYVLAETDRDRLWETFQKWTESPNPIVHANEMRQWLQELGITLTNETFRDLIAGEVKRYGKKVSLKNQMMKGGLFHVLASNIHTRQDASLISGNRLITEGVVKNLAKHEAMYAAYSYSNSHRTGNKTVYSYGQNKYMINRVREMKDFKNGTNPLIDQLSELSFNGASQWIDLLKENGGDNAFTANFDRWIFSLEPLKKMKAKSRDNAEMGKLSQGEIELAKIGMLQASYTDNKNEGNRVIQILYPTTSDKTTIMGLRVLARDLTMDREGNLTDESIETLYDVLVEPEIRRIKSFELKRKNGNTPNVEGYSKGAGQFLFLPEINTIPDVFIGGELNPDIRLDGKVKDAIKNKIKEYVLSLVDEKQAEWKMEGIGEGNNDYMNSEYMSGSLAKKHNPLNGVDQKNRIRGAATDMVFQYLIANAEIAMTFTGDPALYYKQAKVNENKSRTDKDYDFVADAKATYINIGKRLAGDIAPGYELAGANENRYVQGFIADPKSKSEAAFQITKLLDGQEAYDKVKATKNPSELKKTIKGLNSERYYSFDSADAQEYTTWKEHLYVMKQSGELSDEEYNEAYFALSNNKDIVSKKLLGKVMQPMKPVYVDNKIDEADDVEKRIYIKSSSFPLLPQLTRGTDLENLRIAMENQGIDRVAYSTAVKVGNIIDPLNIFGEDGKIIKADEISFTGKKTQLERKGFRIQQKIPEKSVNEITKVTQASKNLFVNMLNVGGFKVPWINDGKEIDGATFQEEYHKVFNQLHEIEKQKLLDELQWNPKTESYNRNELRRILLEEAKSRNYPISDQEMIQLDDELDFLAFSPSSNKYEALLNSIVTNRVIRLKMPGKSYVLGSEEGFQTLSEKEEKRKTTQAGIIYTSKWTGKLLPAREENGIRLPAQALVPWKFKDKRGNLLKMEDYVTKVNGTLVLDSSKVLPEVLQLFGMRIPNQGPNSQSWIEIVGFLPESSGDLLIATKDYVVQMGSDFDVDKLYTYMYNTYTDSKGNIKVQRREEGEDRSAALQNKIIDTHIAIHSNPAVEVQAQIANPLGFWKLKELAEEVVDLHEARADTGQIRVITQKFISRQDLKNNPDKLYLFGDNLEKTGLDGQAKEMRGEPNALGIPTKKKPSMDKDSFFTDDEYEENTLYINEAFDSIPEGRTIVIPEDGFGTGLAKLKEKAPKTFEYLQFKLASLQQAGSRKMFTGLSDKYQRDKFKNATAGKAGVGVFSLDSMFNTIAQGKDLVIRDRDEDGNLIPLEITFGKLTSKGNLSEELALDGKTYKSDIIAGYQSAAVDNEKEQILDKLNINNHTFKVIKILNQLGFGEEVPLFISQDIIVDYVKELDRLGSSLTGYIPNKEEVAKTNVFAMDKYQVRDDEEFNSELAHEKATPAQMRAYIKNGAAEPNYAMAQRLFLHKFVYINDLGKVIQTLQSTINPDSAGLGKSVMESQLKEDQVFDLLASPVLNAELLIGDIVKNPKADQVKKLEAEGYIFRRHGGKVYYVKPSNINGQAIVHGLFTNNDLWSVLFPYKQSGIEAMFNKIEEIGAGSNEVQVADKANRRLAVWKEMKSFFYADESLGLHDSTITQERERLLYDKWDENGNNTKESLATVLRKIKKTEFGKAHPFLSQLEGEPQKNGDPSLVTFNASKAEDPDETAMYGSFIEMLQAEDSDGNSPIITTFNGNSYSLKELAQDLILYSYITGGIQEAIQFVKYIPATYLANIPFMKNLADQRFLARDLEISVMNDDVDEYYNIPTFVQQYFQHHPERLSSVTEEDIIKVKDGFTLKQEVIDVIGKLVSFQMRSPAYVTFRGKTGIKLFKFDTRSQSYKEIDRLGIFGASEYNRNTYDQVSLIERNKKSSKTKNPTNPAPGEPIPEGGRIASRKGRDNLLNDLKNGKQKSLTFLDGKEKIKSVLNEIITYGDDKYQSTLAQEIFDSVDVLPQSFTLSVLNSPTGLSAGQIDYGENDITLYKDTLSSELFNTAYKVNKVFIHELLHALTGYKVRYYTLEKSGEKDRFEAFKRITGVTLTDRERKIIESIDNLREKAKNVITQSPEHKEAYDTFIKNFESKTKGGEVSEAEISSYYGFTNTEEFISQALTDPEFQKLLNNIPFSKERTFWDAIKEKLVNLLKVIGFDVVEGSVLEHTLYETLDLITDNKQTYRGMIVEEGEFQTATGEPGGAQYDREKNIIKINTNLLSEKYNQKAWTTPRKQKDGTYAMALKEDTFTTFEEWKNFVMEHEYQHSVQPKRQEIEGMGVYEDRINQGALKNIYLSNRDAGIAPSNLRAIISDREVEERIKRCKG